MSDIAAPDNLASAVYACAMSQFDTPTDADDDVVLQYSPLERKVERDGVWVKICIYRGEGDPVWLLEVEDHRGGSTVWDDRFETDQAALDEALRSIDEDGIESFAQASGDRRTGRAMWAMTTELPAISEVKRTLDTASQMMSFHATCGLFAAVATVPEMIPPSAWLDMIKGEHAFAGLQEVESFTTGIMALYNEVLRSLGDLGAHCCPDPEDHGAVRAFCKGYLDVALRDPTWEGDQRAYVDLLPMLALAGITAIDKIAQLNPATAADPEAWLQKAREELPETVTALHDYWADGRRITAELLADRARPVRRAVGKVGRNDPCPCGSGKKFKKCHAS